MFMPYQDSIQFDRIDVSARPDSGMSIKESMLQFRVLVLENMADPKGVVADSGP